MHQDTAGDSIDSSTPRTIVRHVERSGVVRHNKLSTHAPPNMPTLSTSRPYRKPGKVTPASSCASYSSSASNASLRTHLSTLTNVESEKFGQRIEEQYKALQLSEAKYCYYIADPLISKHAEEQLKQATDGTYFIRPAEKEEQNSDVVYVLCFVCNKQIARVHICYNKERRVYSFLSGYGFGSEVTLEYTGLDLIIQQKTENTFYELPYPFKICLYRPIQLQYEECIPLPDEVRILDGENTILHELATEGLSDHFNELMQICGNDNHPLRKKALFIKNKINGRNKQGLTPLILAIQARKYAFVELLLNVGVNIDMTDAAGCSPLQHACQQANNMMLKGIIEKNADLHYFNRRPTRDGTYQSNLSAFHYLAMAKDAMVERIYKCAKTLTKCGCPVMTLTKQGQSPFDIAHMYNNSAFECVKKFCGKQEFIDTLPIEVSCRSDAKTMLSDLACPSILGKLRLRLKQCDNRSCVGKNGLFLFYKIRKTKSQSNEEYGLCVYNDGHVIAYPISEQYTSSTIDISKSLSRTVYNYSLITDTPMDDHIQVIVFRSYEELIYSYTQCKGLLPTILTDLVRKEDGELITMDARKIRLPDIGNHTSSESSGGEEYDDINVTLIDHIILSDIQSAKIIDENPRRLIWSAKVQDNQKRHFPIIIKDYLPKNDIDLYKDYRSKQLNNLLKDQSNPTNEEHQFRFTNRSYLDCKNESTLLLKKLRNYPFIVHTFICDHRPKRDLRIFMEYLPWGNLHSYLTKLDPQSLKPLGNAFHWIYQLAQVMAYLSRQKIVHRDLAARNILLKSEKYIKLSDFGLSRLENVELKRSDCFISPLWTAPECIDRQQIPSSSSDVWSFGIVIWEIYSYGAKPYETETKASAQPLVRLLQQYLIEQNRRLPKPDSCSASMYDLMYRCWNGISSKRPCFTNIVDELNGMSKPNDCIVAFTKEEKKLWIKAKAEYLSIITPFQSMSHDDPDYTQVGDQENDNKDERSTNKS